MIRFLQRQRAKKGFTIVELIVVIAIMALLMAVILPQIMTKKSVINSANSAARDFYAVMQTVISKYSMFEGALSPEHQSKPELDIGEMRYFKSLGGNYPYRHREGTVPPEKPVNASVYFELATEGNEIIELYSCAIDVADTDYANGIGLFNLCKRDEANLYTDFGKMLEAEIEDRISYRDGYYYAKVTYNVGKTIKVEYTGYTQDRLTSGSDFTEFKNNSMFFGQNNVLMNGNIFGVCSSYNSTSGKSMGEAGTNLL